MGWATSSSASAAEYTAGASYTNNASVMLYAVWEAKTYTISYNANGGTGAPASQVKTHGVTLTLSNVKPIRSGYSFIGWSTNSTASSASYTAGSSFTGNSNTTLYAVWKVKDASQKLVLPAALQEIDDEAFYGATMLDTVILPQGIKRICSHAFAKSTLTEINLPSSLTFISDDAFTGSDLQIVTAAEGTYAYEWAVASGYISVPITSIVINEDETEWWVGDYVSAHESDFVTIQPANATDKTLSWYSTDTSVVTVSVSSHIIMINMVGLGEAAIIAEATDGVKGVLYVTVVQSNPPAAPTQNASTASGNTVTVSWNAVNDAKSYTVFYNTTNSINSATSVLAGTNTSVTIRDLSYNKTYYTWVKASNNAGFSEASAVKSVKTGSLSKPATPTMNSISASGNTITVTWNKVSGATKYTVYYGTSTSTWGASSADAGDTDSYTITGLSYNKKYYVWVKATNSTGTSNASDNLSVTTDPQPSDPVAFSVTHSQLSGSVLTLNPEASINDYCTLSITSNTAWTASLTNNTSGFVGLVTADTNSATINSSTSAGGAANTTLNLRIKILAVPSAGATSTATLAFTVGTQHYTYTIRMTRPTENAPVFEGSFTNRTKTVTLGQTWIVEGSVSVTNSTLGRVTVNSDDGAGFSLTEDFQYTGNDSVSLQYWAAYTIDTTKAPFNTAGTYTVHLWAKDVNGVGGDKVLDTMTLIIKETYVLDPLAPWNVATAYDPLAQYATDIIATNESSYNYQSVRALDGAAPSIGIFQWNADRALNLLRRIAYKDAQLAYNTLGDALYTEIETASTSWQDKGRLTSNEVTVIKALLGTSTGQEAQYEQAMSDATSYLRTGRNYGITDAEALLQFADVSNLGTGFAQTIASTAKNTAGSYSAITLSVINQAAHNHATIGDSNGYASRHTRTYNTIVSLNLNGDAPAAPIQNAPSASGNSITVSWNSVAGATNYTVYYGTSSSISNASSVSVGNNLTKTITGLQYSTKYYLWVTASNNIGESAKSTSKNITTGSAPSGIITGGLTKTAYTLSQDETIQIQGYVQASNCSIGIISVSIEYGANRALSKSYSSEGTTYVNLADIFTIDPSSNSNFADVKQYNITVYAKAYGSDAAVEIGSATVTVTSGATEFVVKKGTETIIAQGAASGSFVCDPTAGLNAVATFTVTSNHDWTVRASDTSWMSVAKTNSTTAVVTIGNVQDGECYSTRLIFTANGNNYTVNITLDKSLTVADPTVSLAIGTTVMSDGSTYPYTYYPGDTIYLETTVANCKRWAVWCAHEMTGEYIGNGWNTAETFTNATQIHTYLTIPEDVTAGKYKITASVSSSAIANDTSVGVKKQSIVVYVNVGSTSTIKSFTINPSASLQSKLSTIEQYFPSGSYWNHDVSGSTITNVTVTYGNTSYTTTLSDTACPSNHHSENAGVSGATCNIWGEETQCVGFARFLAWMVTGKIVAYEGGWSTDSSYLNNIQAGDLLWITSSSNYGHKIFVTSVSGNTIYYVDCNGDNHCMIMWGRSIQLSSVKTRFRAILRYSDYK